MALPSRMCRFMQCQEGGMGAEEAGGQGEHTGQGEQTCFGQVVGEQTCAVNSAPPLSACGVEAVVPELPEQATPAQATSTSSQPQELICSKE